MIREAELAANSLALGNTGGKRLFKDFQYLASYVSRAAFPLQHPKTSALRLHMIFALSNVALGFRQVPHQVLPIHELPPVPSIGT